MATPRRGRRPLLLAAAALAIVALAAPTVLGVLGLLTVAESFVVTGLVALAGAVVALGAAVLLLRRSMLAVSQEVRTQTRKVTETLGRDRLETIRALDATRARVNRIQSHSLPTMTRKITGAIDRQGRHDYEQQVAWNELTRHLDTAPFMPPLRGWAASPDVLRVLVRHIDRLRPDLVVEFGSGASSVWMGYALRRAGGGRLVAVEHDARYAELSRALVASHGLDDIVEVRTAPLTGIEAVTVAVGDEQVSTADRWYDAAILDDLEGIGLVFVDGPPKATGRHARYPALPNLMPRCTEDVVFVLDDADRPDERAIGDRWLAEYPALHRTEEHAEKGAHVFSRKGV
ncbi:class I SAM-dependent methyltransferase [Nocardiopsis sp. NRRL B-16309]|uniref:class I SAM-dependent methyltransferase n=1 Tax=Nocardiopsis sp. NRRL B-16309 TaxID=1519494 RepID=UPI0006B02C6E|nr:class I SAM-dependent methyltransferase [Nocardiopsis sp. NRRL B-16309]KOX24158.1 methyltransferase [Nocardiopsis sp. NRRL B-16309]